jgi:hypothetical protein
MSRARTCGEFLTPTVYATAAHRYLLRAAADDQTAASLYDTHDWWDPFAGTGRLLEPFPTTMRGWVCASTLAATDLASLRTLPLPDHAHVFQYDFLTQPDEELPDQLRERLRPGSSWVFFLNPPYVGKRTRRGERGQAAVDTAMRAAMLPRRLGRASQNLTTQGLFRLLELVREYELDATVGVFSQASIWLGEGYSEFAKLWKSEFGFVNGFLFDAREFEGVTGAWPATFTIWRRGLSPRPLILDVMERGEIVGRKELLQPEQPLGKWVPRPRNEVPAPQMTSALVVATGNRTRRDKLAEGARATLQEHQADVGPEWFQEECWFEFLLLVEQRRGKVGGNRPHLYRLSFPSLSHAARAVLAGSPVFQMDALVPVAL